MVDYVSAHFDHGDCLVTLPDGRRFFVDHAPDALHHDDQSPHIGQLLCGLAFWFGYQGGTLESFTEWCHQAGWVCTAEDALASRRFSEFFGDGGGI